MKNKGFTLMEVIIAIGLLAIVSAVSVSIVADLLKGALKAQSAMDVEQTMNFISLKIQSDLEKAFNIEVPSSNVLQIYKGTSTDPVMITYTIDSGSHCHGQLRDGLGINCIKRKEGTAQPVMITEMNNDSKNTGNPTKSSVNVNHPEGSASYFSVTLDPKNSNRKAAVNISIEFSKPGVKADGRMRASSVWDTTIVLPDYR